MKSIRILLLALFIMVTSTMAGADDLNFICGYYR